MLDSSIAQKRQVALAPNWRPVLIVKLSNGPFGPRPSSKGNCCCPKAEIAQRRSNRFFAQRSNAHGPIVAPTRASAET
jgi:hypothetical protein